jgi:D-alanyl-D-alanine carboxypeptidase
MPDRRSVRTLPLNAIAASAAFLLLGGYAGTASSAPLACASQPVAQSAVAPALQAKFQQVLDRNKAAFAFPGAQAGIWAAQGSWVGVTGSAAPDGKAAPARGDHTRIGSISKTFTVMLLLQQADKGLISLDDPIGKYVKGLPNGDTATLRMLASMTSGIPSYTFDAGFQQKLFDHPDTVFSPQQLLDYVRGAKALYPAGTRVNYSNSNTVALGQVIEQVTGKSFALALQDGILGPLGMSGTSFPGNSPALPVPHFDGITMQGQPEGRTADATHWNPSWGYSAGAMISTLDDLRCWAVTLGTGGALVSERLQKERLASIDSIVPPTSRAKAYALGFGVFDGWFGHTGELPGYNTSILYDPTSGTTVVAMVNSDIPLGPAGSEQNPAPSISAQLIEAMAAP